MCCALNITDYFLTQCASSTTNATRLLVSTGHSLHLVSIRDSSIQAGTIPHIHSIPSLSINTALVPLSIIAQTWCFTSTFRGLTTMTIDDVKFR